MTIEIGLGILLTLGTIIASAVFFIARIRAAVDVLVTEMRFVRDDLKKLDSTVESVDETIDDLKTRIILIEERSVTREEVHRIVKEAG